MVNNKFLFNDWSNDVNQKFVIDRAVTINNAEKNASNWITPQVADNVKNIYNQAPWMPVSSVITLAKANASPSAIDTASQLSAWQLAKQQIAENTPRKKNIFERFVYDPLKTGFRILQAAAEFPSDIINNIASQARAAGGDSFLGLGAFLPQNLFRAFGKDGWFKSTQLGTLMSDWDKQGEGFALGEEFGKVAGQRARDFRGTINGHAWTIGRDAARVVYTPGSYGYNVISGLIDGAIEIGTDPTNVVGKAYKGIRAGLTNIPTMSKEVATSAARVAAGLADDAEIAYWEASKTAQWLNKSAAANRLVEVISETKSPSQILEAFKYKLPPEVAIKLAGMNDPAQIKAAIGAFTSPFGLMDSVADEAVTIFGLPQEQMIRSFNDIPGSKRLFNNAWTESTVGIAYNKWIKTRVPSRFLNVKGTAVDRARAVENLQRYVTLIGDDISDSEWLSILDPDKVRNSGISTEFLSEIFETTSTGKLAVKRITDSKGKLIKRTYQTRDDITPEKIKTAFLDFATQAYSSSYGTRTAVKATQQLYNQMIGAALRTAGLDSSVVDDVLSSVDDKTEEFRRYFIDRSIDSDDETFLEMLVDSGIITKKTVNKLVDDPTQLKHLRVVGPLALADLLNSVQILPDPRVLRRLNSPVWKRELQRTVVRETGQQRTIPMAIEYAQNELWKPLALASGGYIMRNIIDGQFRMALTGDVSGLFNHPLRYILTTVGWRNKGNILGQSFKGVKAIDDATEAELRSSLDFLQQTISSSTNRRMVDPTEGMASMMRQGDVRVVERQLDRNLHTQAIVDEMAMMREDPIAKMILEGRTTNQILDVLEATPRGQQIIRDLVNAHPEGLKVARENGIRDFVPFPKNWNENADMRRKYLQAVIDGNYRTDRVGWLLAPGNEDLKFAVMTNRVPVGDMFQMQVDDVQMGILNGSYDIIDGPGSWGRSDKVGPGSIIRGMEEELDDAGMAIKPKTFMVVDSRTVKGQTVLDVRQIRQTSEISDDMFEAFAPRVGPEANFAMTDLVNMAGDANTLPQRARWFDRESMDRVGSKLDAKGQEANVISTMLERKRAAVDWWFSQVVDKKFMKTFEKSPFWRQYYYRHIVQNIDTLSAKEATRLRETIVKAAAEEGVSPGRYVGSNNLWRSMQRRIDQAEGVIDSSVDVVRAELDDFNTELTGLSAKINEVEQELKDAAARRRANTQAARNGDMTGAAPGVLSVKIRPSTLLESGRPVRNFAGDEPLGHVLNYLKGRITIEELRTIPVPGRGMLFANMTRGDTLFVASFFQDTLRKSNDVRKKLAELPAVKDFIGRYVQGPGQKQFLDLTATMRLSNGKRIRDLMGPEYMRHITNWLSGSITLDELENIPVGGLFPFADITKDDALKVAAFIRGFDDPAAIEAMKKFFPRRVITFDELRSIPIPGRGMIFNDITLDEFDTLYNYGRKLQDTAVEGAEAAVRAEPSVSRIADSVVDDVVEDLPEVTGDTLTSRIDRSTGERIAVKDIPPTQLYDFVINHEHGIGYRVLVENIPGGSMSQTDIINVLTYRTKEARRTLGRLRGKSKKIRVGRVDNSIIIWVKRDFYNRSLKEGKSVTGFLQNPSPNTKDLASLSPDSEDFISLQLRVDDVLDYVPATAARKKKAGSGVQIGEVVAEASVLYPNTEKFSGYMASGSRKSGTVTEFYNDLIDNPQSRAKYANKKVTNAKSVVKQADDYAERRRAKIDSASNDVGRVPIPEYDGSKIAGALQYKGQSINVPLDDVMKTSVVNGLRELLAGDISEIRVEVLLGKFIPNTPGKALPLEAKTVVISAEDAIDVIAQDRVISSLIKDSLKIDVLKARTDPEYRAGLLDRLSGDAKDLPRATSDVPSVYDEDAVNYVKSFLNSPAPRDLVEQELYDLRQDLYKKRAMMKGLVADTQDRIGQAERFVTTPTGTLEDLDMFAGNMASREIKERFFDSAEKNNLMDATRVIAPFGAAWASIIGDYAGLLIEDPTRVRRAQRAYVGMSDADPAETGQGFFHKDPITGVNMFVFPLSGSLAELVTGVNAPLAAPVQRLSVGYTFIPSLGPAGQIAADALFRAAGDPPSLDSLSEIILPYGRNKSVASNLMPGWLDKGLQAIRGNKSQLNTVFANTYIETVRALSATGEYDMRTPDGVDRLLKDAKGKAQVLTAFRALSQFLGPTAGSPAFRVDTLAGEDIYVGQLIKEFYDLQANNYDTAVQRFLEIHGPDAMLYLSGKSRSTQSGLEATEQFGDWEQSSGEFLSKYSEVGAYFAPGGDDFSFSVWERQIRSGKRERLTDREIVAEAQNRLGSARYRDARLKVGAYPSAEQKEWLREYRDRLAVNYPGFPRVAQFEVGRLEGQIDQLRLAVNDRQVQDSPIAEAITKYLSYRDQALGQLAKYGLVSLQSKTAEPLRDWLAGMAYQLVLATPEFGRLYDRVLSPEVED